MIIKCCSFNEFKKLICKDQSPLVLFGAGAIGGVVAPEILNDYGILDRVACYIDNDESKWETTIEVCGRSVAIHSPEYIGNMPDNTVLLLNISRFSDVIEQLSAMESTKNMMCIIMPMMLIHNYCMSESAGTPVKAEKPLIPKKLHFMHLGGGPLSDGVKRCMDSWEKFCPDYDIIEWNEDNYDIGKNLYMQQAYDAGAYGFAPDYARLDILYNEGGIYLDTDVEIRRSIDDLLYQEAFCGLEKWQIINFGGMSGSIPRHPMIKKFLDAREELRFIGTDGRQNRNTCGYYDTRTALKEGYVINGMTQHIGGMNIYAYDYFQPYDYTSGIFNETRNTYSVHWFNGGWMDDEMRQANEDTKKRYSELYNRAVNNEAV